MPEKPKRRKNNKNKRKNKNIRSDPVNNSDVKKSDADETCAVLSELQVDSSTSELKDNLENDVPNSSGLLSEIKENDLVTECNSSQISVQDLNNNSENVEAVPNPVINYEENESQISETYIVESPDQSEKSKVKLSNKVKSKSLDNDEEPKIEEITEDSCEQFGDDTTIAIIDSNVLVSDVESDVEWQQIEEDSASTQPKEIGTGTLSITTIPLNVAQCEQTKSLTPEEEMSLRHYLQTLNLSTNPSVSAIEIKTEIEEIINREIRHRLRKKGLADDFASSRLAPPRILDVIDEESGESSLTSRRQSYLSDKKSDNEDLEDDVFEDKPKPISHTSKPPLTPRPKTFGRLVPQECVLVGAKIKEPEVAEARGGWTVQTVEKMKGAEVVYLTDSSSSTSSIHEIDEDVAEENNEDSVRMITPTIEVTDTDNLLKKTFLSEAKDELHTISGQIENLTKKANDFLVKDNQNECSLVHTDNIDTTNAHEIVVSCINDIKTDLYVKDVEEIILQEKDPKGTILNNVNISKLPENCDYDLEIKVLKCELNDAINNLIKEVCSDSETNEDNNVNFVRQDSSSSIGSSQCTAKYNPTYSSLNDVSNFVHDETCGITKLVSEKVDSSHVKDVFECVTGATVQEKNDYKITKEPLTLRDLCVGRITTLPYGDKILEELASVSERLQNINSQNLLDQKSALNDETPSRDKMPYYPLPDVSTIEKVTLPLQCEEIQPPPVKPRNSSLKKCHDEHHWTGVPTKSEPVYVCLSPSQKMLMEKTNTFITKEGASQLVDMHKKFVDRRGYNEPSPKNKTLKSEDKEQPPIVPFKSQTGSRLLALIRDPSVTSNINSTVNNRNYSFEQLKRDNEFSYQNKDTKHKSGDITSTLKPIPPPRPKKYSSSYYESDESSDFTDTSLRSVKSERKFFHFSTGNLNKDIENDISSIQNMHRYYTNVRDNITDFSRPRRPSLPKDLCDQQMEYIRQKEKEVEAEIKRLEQEKSNVSTSQQRGPRAPLITEREINNKTLFESSSSINSKKDPILQTTEKRSNNKLSSLFSSSQEELLRDKMYTEYVSQMAERQERKQHKIIKITNPSSSNTTVSKSMSALDILDSKVNNRIEKEFISKAKERWNKLGIADPETEDEREMDVYREPKVIEHKIKVIECGEEKDMQKLPNHLQEFVNFTAKQKEQGAGSSGESGSGSASSHVQIWCAVIILVLAVVKYFLRLFRNL